MLLFIYESKFPSIGQLLATLVPNFNALFVCGHTG